IAESIVIVSICYCPSTIKELSNRSMAVVAREADRRIAAYLLDFIANLKTICIAPNQRSVLQFFDNLGTSSGVFSIYEKVGGNASNCFGDTITISVINNGDIAMCDKAVLEIIGVGNAT